MIFSSYICSSIRKRRISLNVFISSGNMNNTFNSTGEVASTVNTSPPNLPLEITIVFALLSVLITISNISICALVYIYRQLRTFTNGIIVSLAVSDLILGAIWLPTYILYPYDTANGYLTALILLSNISNLCSLTLERVIAVTKPIEYRYIIAKYFTKMIVLSWVVPLIVTLVPLAWEPDSIKATDTAHRIYLIILLVIFIIIPYMFIISVYSVILCYVHKRQQRRNRILARDEVESYRAQFKVIRLFFLITLLFSVGWISAFYLTLCNIIGRDDLKRDEIAIFNVFGLSFGSLANGFLYAFFKPDFKKVAQKILSKLSHKRNLYEVNSCDSPKDSFPGRLRGSQISKPMKRDTPVNVRAHFVSQEYTNTTRVVCKLTAV